MNSIDFRQIAALTFDCYGTLIDWETGILNALGPLLVSRRGRACSNEELLERYAAAEAEQESGSYRPYRDVLSAVSRAIARDLGASLEPEDEPLLARSIGQWPAFPDTPAALAQLASRFRLMVLSNVDRDLFAMTRPHLGPAPLELITAEDVRAYKPAPAHFHEALRRLQLPASSICHVAQSLFHDTPVATSLGFRTVWINRRHSRPGHGATPAATATPDLELPDLASLAALAAPA